MRMHKRTHDSSRSGAEPLDRSVDRWILDSSLRWKIVSQISVVSDHRDILLMRLSTSSLGHYACLEPDLTADFSLQILP